MAKALTKRAYARRRGVSEAAVRKAVKSGRIAQRSDGKINPDVADRQWTENTDITKPLNDVTGQPKHRKPSPDAPSEPMALDGKRGKTAKDNLAGFSKARTQREILRALRERLAYERDVEGWVPLERLQAAAAAAGEIVCNRLMTRHSRIAKVLGGVTDIARRRKILRDDDRKTCEELKKALARAARGEK